MLHGHLRGRTMFHRHANRGPSSPPGEVDAGSTSGLALSCAKVKPEPPSSCTERAMRGEAGERWKPRVRGGIPRSRGRFARHTWLIHRACRSRSARSLSLIIHRLSVGRSTAYRLIAAAASIFPAQSRKATYYSPAPGMRMMLEFDRVSISPTFRSITSYTSLGISRYRYCSRPRRRR